jgi:hypothetical protein
VVTRDNHRATSGPTLEACDLSSGIVPAASDTGIALLSLSARSSGSPTEVLGLETPW